MIAKPARLSRVAAVAYWTVPSLFCLWLYWYGLLSWFTQDDFAWLRLRTTLQSFDDFWRAMFAPMAQGSIRPWSERGFFMLFSWAFGFDALPYRVFVFVTQFANLILLASLTRKLTGSTLAGFLAPLLWTANSALAVPLSWTSSYNQILCAFFLLAALRLFVRYTETGRLKDYGLQFTLFLLGFGALELNVVYPALAASYAVCCARRYVWHSIPMFVFAAGYALLHRSVAPTREDPVYTMYFDSTVLSTLGEYIVWALGSTRRDLVPADWAWVSYLAIGAIGAGLLGFASRQMRRGEDRCRRLIPAFFIGWFFIVLAPVLPLRNHISDYYLTIPTAGLAALGGWGIAWAWRAGWHWRSSALLLAAVYLAVSIPAGRTTVLVTYELSESLRRLVFGVERARELHPGKSILLADVSNYLFWKGILDEPFRLLGITDVYLAPGTEGRIETHPELGAIEEYIFPPGLAASAIDRKKAVVYSAAGPVLRNITSEYRSIIAAKLPSAPAKRIDLGNPIFEHQLGPGWYQNENGFRWMGKRGVVQLGGPEHSGEKLHITGMCDSRQLADGPLGIQVNVNGLLIGQTSLQPGEPVLQTSWSLPPALTGIKQITVEVEVQRTVSPPGDGRELGLAVGSMSVR